MNRVVSFAFAVTLMGAAMNASACDKPSAPVLPDPNSAVTPQMVKAKNEVQDYISKAEAYLSCVKDASAHNAMVDEMKGVADTFNSAIKTFKARMSCLLYTSDAADDLTR